MLQGPCGARNHNSSFMIPNKDEIKAYRVGYSKLFNKKMHLHPNDYPYYARPDNGRVIIKNGIKYDNRWVFPHNCSYF